MELLIRVHSRKGLPFFTEEIFRFLLLAHSCIKIMYQRQPLLCFSFGKSMLVFYLLPIFSTWQCHGILVFMIIINIWAKRTEGYCIRKGLESLLRFAELVFYFFLCFLHMIYITAADLVHLMVLWSRFSCSHNKLLIVFLIR